jgi:hypothetical protein
MSRISFILAVTLLISSGSLVFMKTFDRSQVTQETSKLERADRQRSGQFTRNHSSEKNEKRSISARDKATRVSLPEPATAHLTSGELAKVSRIVFRTNQEARQTLDEFSRHYGLSTEQRQDIFPFIVAHHENAHPAMMINGQPLTPVAPGSSIEASIAPFLSSRQQEALAEDLSDHYAWWEDVVGQLEDDLDNAISNGEMVPADEDTPYPETTSAAGDGDASGHTGANLFDLLGR